VGARASCHCGHAVRCQEEEGGPAYYSPSGTIGRGGNEQWPKREFVLWALISVWASSHVMGLRPS
jgi:hypothetical protein